MNRRLLIGILSLLVSSFIVLMPAARADTPYFLAYGLGNTGLGCGWCGYGPNLPSPAPYFAMHPPVYYSYPVAYPYGVSPFPNLPGALMCGGMAADPPTTPATHPAPLRITNPYVSQSDATATTSGPLRSRPVPKVIYPTALAGK